MHFKNTTGAADRQRSVVPTIPPDKLFRRAQYKYLKDMGVTTLWWDALTEWRSTRLTSWKVLCDFPAKFYFYHWLDDECRLCPIDNSTEHSKLCRFLGLPYDIGDWRHVLKRYGLYGHLMSCVTAPVARGKRSDVIFKIGMTLRERGASAAEIACVLRASRCWQDKHGNNERALDREVERIMAKWRPHGH